MSCLSKTEILSHLSGKTSKDEAAGIADHLESCQRCAEIHRQVVAELRRLAPDPGEFADAKLTDDIMTLVQVSRNGARRAQTSPWWAAPRFWVPALSASVACAALFLWLGLSGGMPGAQGFTARGDNAADPDRWVRFQVFRASPEGYRPVGRTVDAGDRLAFAYDNRETSYRFLMLLAVQGGGEIFWFYPTYLREGSNPDALSIANTAGFRALPDEIQHPLKAGPLAVLGIFSGRPLRVLTVEAAVREELARVGSVERLRRLAGLGGTGQQVIVLEVAGSRESGSHP